MPDLAPEPQARDNEVVAGPACCPNGTCGPIFETPLLELAFSRIRDLLRGRNTADAAHAAAIAPPPHQHKDAPHD